MDNQSIGHARRRFLTGATGLAASPLLAGIAVGCTTEAEQDSRNDTPEAPRGRTRSPRPPT